MRVAQEGVTAAQHEDRSEQVPLDFQQSVGADVENFAHDGIARADERGRQDEPHGDFADELVDRIDQAREF